MPLADCWSEMSLYPDVPRVVIVGGGFGGLAAARALRRAPVCVTLIDRRNHHLFQPLLYEVATAALNPADIAAPLRRILRRQANAEVLLGDVIAIDAVAKRVILADEALSWDFLVLAAGATHSYFGHDEWARYAPGLKSLEDALDIRRRLLLAFEAAEREPDPALRREWLTFVVVGGGPTGVELAGAIADVARGALAFDFRHIDPTSARVVLLEAKPHILPTYPPDLADRAERKLRKLGVEVRTHAVVTAVEARRVRCGAESVVTRTVFWSAGVRASELPRTLGAPLDAAGRVLVAPDLTVPGRKDLFVVGDLAALSIDGKPVPGIAPAAMQEGKHAAENIVRWLNGERYRPFRYRDKGMLAALGRASAVADVGRVKLVGFTAWLMWVVVHIYYLIGFRNRLAVLFEWAYKYLTWERGARLITGEQHPLMLRSSPPMLEPPERVAMTAPAPATRSQPEPPRPPVPPVPVPP